MKLLFFKLPIIFGRNFLTAMWLLLILSPFFFQEQKIPTRYHIEAGSKLLMTVYTNITQVKCNCEEKFLPQPINLSAEEGQIVTFNQTLLHLNKFKLNCGNNLGINKDMRLTLQAAQYPQISIELKKLVSPEELDYSEWMEWDAHLTITIAQVHKNYILPVRIKSLGENRFRITAFTIIRLSDHQLTPPKPMLGMIKIYDEVDINFDLLLHIS